MKTLAMQSQSGKEFDKEVLLSLLEEPYYVPEGTSLQTQLLHFQKNRRRFGLVVDEYGDIMGAITLEDILEEIVGEFTSDPTSTLRSQISKSVTDDSYIIDASMAVRLINRTLDTNFPEDEARTLNGLILEALEDIPTAGMKTAINGHNLEIMRMDGRRVKTVKIMPFAEPAAKSVA
jgi:Mg2+/Co2+ transporter CorB